MAYNNAYVQMDSISSPSSVLMLGDGGPKENGGGSNWYKFPINERARDLPFQMRHSNGLNGAFWDGHSEWMARNEVNWFEPTPFYFNSLKFPWY
jgi:prepilin-type processing-associated H-X9-DG protein